MGAEDFSFYQEKIQGYTFFRSALKASQYLKQLHHTQIFILMKVVLFWNENHVNQTTVDYMVQSKK
jgi:metal-dependent amidase/aminoacylase/carboxypeptidase family protein